MTCTHTPAEADATFKEVYDDVVADKMVHVVIHLGLPVGELGAVVEALEQWLYKKTCWKAEEKLLARS